MTCGNMDNSVLDTEITGEYFRGRTHLLFQDKFQMDKII